MSFLIVQFFFF